MRHAINYCVNRDGLVALLNGLAEPAYGLFKRSDVFFGHPKQEYKYDPAKAKAHLAAAGYAPGQGPTIKLEYSMSYPEEGAMAEAMQPMLVQMMR